MKKLENLVMNKDEKICKIFDEMEQVLFRIPVSTAKPLFEVYIVL